MARSWSFDLETFGRLDVFQVDAAEGRLEGGNGRDHVGVHARGVDLDVEYVDAGEFLEEDGLAFHDGLGGERADIAEAQNSGAVGDDGDQIGAGRIVVGGGRIILDRKTGGRDAWGIGKCQIALVAERLGGLDLQFAGTRIAVIEERLFVEISGRVCNLRLVFVLRSHRFTGNSCLHTLPVVIHELATSGTL